MMNAIDDYRNRFPHFSVQKINCEPIAGEKKRWDEMPICLNAHCGEVDERPCIGIDCPAFLRIDQYDGLCAMIPGMLDYVVKNLR